MKISLTRGYVVTVDKEDFESLSKFKWSALVSEGRVYAVRRQRRQKPHFVYMHREIMGFPRMVDHANGNTLDNRKKNLRKCSPACNARNRGKSSRNTSGFKGVTFDKPRNQWKAQTALNGRHVNIGRYRTKRLAARAYDDFARENFREFARTNFRSRAS